MLVLFATYTCRFDLHTFCVSHICMYSITQVIVEISAWSLLGIDHISTNQLGAQYE